MKKEKRIEKIIFDDRWHGENGISRFSREILRRIEFVNILSGSNPFSLFQTMKISLSAKKNNYKIFSPGFITGIKNVGYICIHDTNHLDIEDNSSLLKRTIYRNYIFHLVRRCDAVFTVSNFSKNQIIKWTKCSPEKVIVVGNGTSDCFTPKEIKEREKKYIFCCSNRKKHKNEITLIYAFKKSCLYEKYDLIFSGAKNTEHEEIIRNLDLSREVLYTGNLTDEQLAQYYSGAEFSVFPSLYEGFGLPIIESMACGTPVICSNATAIPEVGGDAAIYFSPLNIDELSTAMKTLDQNKELRNSMIKKGFENVKRFTWNRVVDKIKTEIEK